MNQAVVKLLVRVYDYHRSSFPELVVAGPAFVFRRHNVLCSLHQKRARFGSQPMRIKPALEYCSMSQILLFSESMCGCTDTHRSQSTTSHQQPADFVAIAIQKLH